MIDLACGMANLDQIIRWLTGPLPVRIDGQASAMLHPCQVRPPQKSPRNPNQPPLGDAWEMRQATRGATRAATRRGPGTNWVGGWLGWLLGWLGGDLLGCLDGDLVGCLGGCLVDGLLGDLVGGLLGWLVNERCSTSTQDVHILGVTQWDVARGRSDPQVVRCCLFLLWNNSNSDYTDIF